MGGDQKGRRRTATRYDEHPDHPLCGIDQAVLDAARKVMNELGAGDVIDPGLAEPIADAIVLELRLGGFLKDGSGG